MYPETVLPLGDASLDGHKGAKSFFHAKTRGFCSCLCFPTAAMHLGVKDAAAAWFA